MLEFECWSLLCFCSRTTTNCANFDDKEIYFAMLYRTSRGVHNGAVLYKEPDSSYAMPSEAGTSAFKSGVSSTFHISREKSSFYLSGAIAAKLCSLPVKTVAGK